MNTVPKHIRRSEKMTGRQWKAKKRIQLRQLERALSDLRMGCAYFPMDGIDQVDEIAKLIVELKWKLSVARWGR